MWTYSTLFNSYGTFKRPPNPRWSSVVAIFSLWSLIWMSKMLTATKKYAPYLLCKCIKRAILEKKILLLQAKNSRKQHSNRLINAETVTCLKKNAAVNWSSYVPRCSIGTYYPSASSLQNASPDKVGTPLASQLCSVVSRLCQEGTDHTIVGQTLQGLGTGTLVIQLVAERPRKEKLWRAVCVREKRK